GRGDIKRFFDQYEHVKQKSQALDHDVQNFQEIQQDLYRLRVILQGDLFHDDSLLVRALRNTLTGEQFARYEAVARRRRALRHRASIEEAIGILERGISLRDAQRRELLALLAKETKPSRRPGPYDAYALVLQLRRLPEDKLKHVFD